MRTLNNYLFRYTFGKVLSAAAIATVAGSAFGVVTPHYTVTDVGTLPGYTATTYDAPGGQILNDAGQIVVLCSRVVDPGDCATLKPAKVQYTPARFTPGVGLQDLSVGATELSSTPVAIDSAGRVLGFAKDYTWVQQPGPFPCYLKPFPISGRVWEYADPGNIANFTAPDFVNKYAARGGLHNINDHGMAILTAFDINTNSNAAGRFVGGVWQDSSEIDPRLVSNNTIINDLNQADQICGTVIGAASFAFRYSDSKGLEVLPDLGISHSTSAIAINNNGDIAASFGFGGSPNRSHAAFYRSGQPGIDIHNSALAVQSVAQYIGGPYVTGYLLDGTNASSGIYRWDSLRGMVQIPVDPTAYDFGVLGINDLGAVIGNQLSPLDPQKPWVWTPRTGTVYLRDAIGDPDEQDWQLLSPLAINNRGQIAISAFGAVDGHATILLLTPDNNCPADFDGSGAINVSDIFAFLRSWFAKSPDADFDNSATINVSDIFAFLRGWFSKCQ